MHWRRTWQPTPVFLPGESQGRGSLVGCRLWGCTESDTTDATQQQQKKRKSTVVNTLTFQMTQDKHQNCYYSDITKNKNRQTEDSSANRLLRPWLLSLSPSIFHPVWRQEILYEWRTLEIYLAICIRLMPSASTTSPGSKSLPPGLCHPLKTNLF